jgi:hypothetical protein
MGGAAGPVGAPIRLVDRGLATRACLIQTSFMYAFGLFPVRSGSRVLSPCGTRSADEDRRESWEALEGIYEQRRCYTKCMKDNSTGVRLKRRAVARGVTRGYLPRECREEVELVAEGRYSSHVSRFQCMYITQNCVERREVQSMCVEAARCENAQGGRPVHVQVQAGVVQVQCETVRSAAMVSSNTSVCAETTPTQCR